jgi:hypothetical protein
MSQLMFSNVATAVHPEPPTVALADVKVTPAFRASGVSREHVMTLVELGGGWPPVLVQRSDCLVIDGAHRVAAARLLGWQRIEVTFFDGTAEEALLEFLGRNVEHGLPLSLRDRKQAGRRVLTAHAEWSDRRIAEMCGISPKTVGAMRANVGPRPIEELSHLDTLSRIGRDNRSRPVDTVSVRARVVEAIKTQPDASLRAIAAVAGVSPETVRLVRMNLRTAPVVSALTDHDEARPTAPQQAACVEPEHWRDDAALSSCDGADDFLGWFDRTSVCRDECTKRVDAVPLGRIYQIADEARRRSELWMQFAKSLEARSARR